MRDLTPRVEHDWMTFDDGWELVTVGFGLAPFTAAPLLPCDHDRFHHLLDPYTVARMTFTRARLFPAWAWALCEHLWRDAPEVAIRDALDWASTTSTPHSYAAALVVVYLERRRYVETGGGSFDAIALRRLILQSMQDLRDEQRSLSPHEVAER